MLIFLLSFASSKESDEGSDKEPKKWLTFVDQRNKGNIIKFKQWKAEKAIVLFTHNPNGYRVSITTTSSCDPAEKYFSDNSTLSLLKQQEIGPDEILVHLEGASIQVQLARLSSSHCNEYYALFQVPLSGPYRLKIVRLRKDYRAVSDTVNVATDITYEKILDVSLESQLAYFAPVPCESVQGYWVSVNSSGLREKPMKVKKECIKQDSKARGLSFQTHIFLNNIEDTCALDIDKFAWNREICNSLTYDHPIDKYGSLLSLAHDNINNLPEIRASDNAGDAKWFKGKKIIFIGDGHMNNLADIFVRHVCKYPGLHNDAKVELDIENSVKYFDLRFTAYNALKFKKELRECGEDPSSCTLRETVHAGWARDYLDICIESPDEKYCELFDRGCSDSAISYLGAKYCQTDIAKFVKGYDFAVLNCGHQPAKFATYTYSLYTKALDNFAKTLADLPKNVDLFWLENSAEPLHAIDDFLGRKTYQRLLLFDIIARESLRRNNIRFLTIQAFHETLALYDKICDCQEYPPAVIMPQLIQLLSYMKGKIPFEKK